MTSQRDTGLRIFAEVYGDAAADGVRQHLEGDAFGVEQARWAIDFAFGSVWSREGLDRKLRSAAVLGMLIGMRQADEIAYHTQMGMANGLSITEIEEILYTGVPYCGLPATNIAKAAMKKALAEMAGNGEPEQG